MNPEQFDKKRNTLLSRLRDKAEALVAQTPKTADAPESHAALEHELQVHQVELEMQNEQLRQAQLALEESRDRYLHLYEFAPVAYLTINQDGMISEINLKGATMLAAERKQLLQRSFGRFVAVKDQDRWYRLFNSARRNEDGQEQNADLILIPSNGSQLNIQLNCVRTNALFEPLSLRVTLIDITERKRAAAELSMSEQRFRSIFEQAAVGIALVATDGRWLRVNQRLCDIVGYSHEELLTKTFQDITHPDDLYSDLENVQQMLSGKIQTYSMEKRYIRKDGKQVWVNLTVALVRNADETPDYFISVVEDIQARKLSETELRRAEQDRRIAAIAFDSHEGMIITDAGSRILKVNRAFTRITGYSADEAVGKKPSFLSSGRHDAKFYEGMWKSLNAEGVWEGEVWNKRKSGELYPEHLTITAVIDKDGQVTHYVGALTDSTQRQQTLDKLRTTAVELEFANVQIEEERSLLAERVAERTAELQFANKAKDSFLATMSHEIRTPLGGLMGMMELLDLTPLDTEQHDLLHTARVSAYNLLRIVNDILDWSKIEAGKLELAPRPASIATLLEGVGNTYMNVASAKGISLRWHCDANLSAVHLFDALRISQIVNNFTSNAIKFTEQGTIEIEAERVAQYAGIETVRFSVKDSGIGITPEQQSRIFVQYEQASNDTARMYGGTGLGLAISHRLADLMKGTLGVESSAGVGSTFFFTVDLPIAKLVERRESQKPFGANERRKGKLELTTRLADGHRLTILIVDDHPVNRMLLKQQLGILGLQVEDAASGTPALSLWQTGRFDLVITDCHMPEMDGYELTEVALNFRTVR